LVPLGDEVFELLLILLLNLELLAVVLVCQGDFESELSLFAHFDDLTQTGLSLLPLTVSLVRLAELAERMQVRLHVRKTELHRF